MSSNKEIWMKASAIFLVAAMPQSASAQSLMDMSTSQLRSEVQSRYDAALALSTSPHVVAQNSAVHGWSSDAKVQCGIALGFLRSSTKDEDSLRRCDFAYNMMNMPRQAPPAAVAVAPPPLPAPASQETCPPDVAATFFFDFNSIIPSADAQQSAQFMQDNRQRCGWQHFTVVGHTDRAGSNIYNENLSLRRGQSVADLMTAAGIPASAIAVSGKGESDLRVQTIDGERTPANRRVEVRVNMTGVNQ